MQRNTGNILIAISIVIAGAIIALAVVVTREEKPVTEVEKTPASLEKVREVTKDDHIMGNLDAPVVIIEYSDLECPFCGALHPTLEKVVEKYDGQVAWVYRHFPLSSIHPDAQALAEGSECVAELAGNDAFWTYIDGIFKGESIESITESVGVSGVALAECVESGKYTDHVLDDLKNATETGGGGTPWSIVIGPDGEKFAVNGAQPIEAWDQLIFNLLK